MIATRIHATPMSSASSSSAFLTVEDGFAVRQGHLAPPSVTPDSPRPQKPTAAAESLSATLKIPTSATEKSLKPSRATSKSPSPKVTKKKP
ncbi:hypothetical protein AAVH_04943 [Aphelenchoides avenae]|nr:hypothetical protein AAVH_04943 [Aphelenchus avenae]